MLNKIYNKCIKEGMFIPQETINKDKIETMLKIVEEDRQSIQDLKDKKRYNTLYKLSYEVIRTLSEIILSQHKLKVQNHKCLFAYICTHYKELDWNFFEKIRTKRNGIHYYGSSVNKQEWTFLSLEVDLTTKQLLQIIINSNYK